MSIQDINKAKHAPAPVAAGKPAVLAKWRKRGKAEKVLEWRLMSMNHVYARIRVVEPSSSAMGWLQQESWIVDGGSEDTQEYDTAEQAMAAAERALHTRYMELKGLFEETT